MIIAIDGPAGSGKSSTAKAVARELGFQHLDSGAFYRALTHAALSAGLPVTTWHHLAAAQLDSLRIKAESSNHGHRFTIDGRDITAAIRSPDVNAHVSEMARVPAVREWLLEQLRAAGTEGDLVADGRDIGTVVFPGAELKIFLTANPRERARRRLVEQGLEPTEEELDRESGRLGNRDRIDSEREVAPLRVADDAIVLDSTGLTFQEQVQRIVALARQKAGKV
jgi:cytidylate kinase